MKRRLSLLSNSFLIVGLLASSCNKDKVPVPDDGAGTSDSVCQDIVFLGGETFGITVTSGIQYTAPCFNPFDENEFIYIKIYPVGSNPARELVKYNIQTETETVLCNTNDVNGWYIGYQANWGNDHWITFTVGTGSSGVGYIIRDDGTQLSQFLPTSVNVTKPRFDQTGTRIITFGEGVPNTEYPSLPIYDLLGNIVDTFIFGRGDLYWGYPDDIESSLSQMIVQYTNHGVSPKQQGIGHIVDDTLLESLYTFENSQLAEILGLDQFENKIYYLKSQDGLYMYNSQTHTNHLFRGMCDSRRMQSMSVSKISGNIIIEEVKRTKLDEFGSIDAQSNIILFNPLTGKTTPILVE